MKGRGGEIRRGDRVRFRERASPLQLILGTMHHRVRTEHLIKKLRVNERRGEISFYPLPFFVKSRAPIFENGF